MSSSSGIKKGLAISAVSAMAIVGVGLSASSASADSIPTQAGANNVVLVAPTATTSSTANDGKNTSIHLVAEAGSGVSQIQFVYNNGSDHNIGAPVVVGTNGYVDSQWTPDAVLNNTAVTISAVGLDGLGNVVDTATAPAATTISPGANAVNLSTTPATIGVYPAPGGGAHLYGI
ncbi:MAG: hypothetical protein JWR35_2222, partial [Marmoricola sp.]|nr:hypothetical protein [Marmoricola sp.]